VNRLIDPGSEFRVHRQWFDQSAMDVLLGVDFAVAEKDRLYRAYRQRGIGFSRRDTGKIRIRCISRGLVAVW